MGGEFLKEKIKEQLTLQGHELTGALNESISYNVKGGKNPVLEGYAANHFQYVEYGFSKEKASYAQKDYLIDYFLKRGLEEKDAKRAAYFTIVKWKEEGMSTKASAKYSKNGKRNKVLQNVFEEHGPALDKMILDAFDSELDHKYREEKSETI